MTTWNLQDAKNRFSALVREALKGEVQYVTRRGKPAVVVVATEEFDRLRGGNAADSPSFVELLLSIPQGEVEFERLRIEPRDVEFEE